MKRETRSAAISLMCSLRLPTRLPPIPIHQTLVKARDTFLHSWWIKLLPRPLITSISHATRSVRIGKSVEKSIDCSINTVYFNEPSGFTILDDIGSAADVCSYAGKPGVHRLCKGTTEPFPQTGHHKYGHRG